MRFKSKGVLVTLVAVLAMSAVVASAASATTIRPLGKEFVAKSGNTSFTMPNGAKMECEPTTAKGVTPAKENEGGPIPVTLRFEKCTNFGSKDTVTVSCEAGDSNSLTFDYGTPITSELSLSSGCNIEIKASTCSMNIAGAQTLAGTWLNETFPALSTDTIGKAPLYVTTSPTSGSACGERGEASVGGTFKAETTSKGETLTVEA